VSLSATDSDPGQTSFTWSASPLLPNGLVLNPTSGVISGTPTDPAATATYTLSATDTSGAAGTTTVSITVS
jgi:hypothetical protein